MCLPSHQSITVYEKCMTHNFILQEFFPDWFQVSSKEEIVVLEDENNIEY